jgi:hypothetical protein
VRGDEDAATAERGRRVHERVHPRGGSVEGKPEAPQAPRLAPCRRAAAVVGGKVLSQRGQQDIPALVAGARRLISQ